MAKTCKITQEYRSYRQILIKMNKMDSSQRLVNRTVFIFLSFYLNDETMYFKKYTVWKRLAKISQIDILNILKIIVHTFIVHLIWKIRIYDFRSIILVRFSRNWKCKFTKKLKKKNTRFNISWNKLNIQNFDYSFNFCYLQREIENHTSHVSCIIYQK